MDIVPATIKSYNCRNKYFVFLFFLTISLSCYLFAYGYSKHYCYLTSINDVGHIDQSIWGTMHGKLFLNTINFNIETIGRIEPILLIFIPFYFILPSIVWLILAQSIFIPGAGLAIFFTAKKICHSDEAAFFWALSFLISPFVMNAASWDFHPVFLAVPFIPLAFLALEGRRPRLFLLSCLLILMSKEHFGLLVSGFGILWYIKNKDLKFSFTITLIGFFYFIAMMNMVVPWTSPTGQHPMISNDMGQLSRYGWLGENFEDVLLTVFSRPLDVIRVAFYEQGGWLYVFLLIAPLLFLPIFGFEFLLPGMADFLANFLSSNPMPRSIFSYHSVTLIPVILVSAIYGSKRLHKLLRLAKPELQAFSVFIFVMLMAFEFSCLFATPDNDKFWLSKQSVFAKDDAYAEVCGLIDQKMSVTAQANVGAHFTQRDEIYMYPNKTGSADIVVLHLSSPTYFVRERDRKEIGSLAHHLQMDPEIYLESVRSLLSSDVYGRIVWLDPWLVFFKGKPNMTDRQEINMKIDKLAKEWGIYK